MHLDMKKMILLKKKKCKGTAKYIVKQNNNFETLKQTLLNNQTFMRNQQRFSSEELLLNTEIVNKKALSNQDNKRLKTFDGITAYPSGCNPFIICKSEMMVSLKNKFNNNMIKLTDKDKCHELMNLSIPLYY